MNFFHLGIEHIGATPDAWMTVDRQFQVADGVDHVLFILVLVLLCSTWKSLLLNATGFTVGHSLSLGLSLSGIFSLPAKFSEVAIAMSIAYLAFEVFRNKKSEQHLALTTVFGFIHGMGFSYVLQGINLGSSFDFLKVLFFFNFGIEVGQIIIVIIICPLFFYKNKENRSSHFLKKSIGLIVFLLACYWSFDRFTDLLMI